MRFTYNSGQRPLDGYTIKRGIGRGGFGEVYFAVSDGGKEVALKHVRAYDEFELRGASQVLNLKHPNLVLLYDLRIDAKGDHWIVMEKVTGDSLHAFIRRHPNGLPKELIYEWFQSLAKAVAYLHDQGIIHRDLKPANIFIENGVVKVGDYGLSRSISESQGRQPTQSVGTIHYMAPEIWRGHYSKQVDIYAAGIILYEMLTGQVPFTGTNYEMVQTQHMADDPDWSKVPTRFVPILKRALNKDCEKRFDGMNDFADAVEALATPTTLPMPQPTSAPTRRPEAERTTSEDEELPKTSSRAAELCGSLVFSAVLALFATGLWAGLSGLKGQTELGAIFFLTVSACWIVLIPGQLWKEPKEESWPRRLTMSLLGLLLGVHALWLNGWDLPSLTPSDRHTPFSSDVLSSTGGIVDAFVYLYYFGILFMMLRWWKLAERGREQRFSLPAVAVTGLWAVILLRIWPHHQQSAVSLVLASAIIQMVSPWESLPDQPATPKRQKLRITNAA